MQDSPTPSRSFGELLRSYRTRAGLSQADLAERSGLSVSAIGALERGTRSRPYAHTRRQLADALRLRDDERAAFLGEIAPPASLVDGPPQLAVAQVQTDITASLTPLIGRTAEIRQLRDWITSAASRRLVTLTGMAGIGKTRLALQLAHEAAPDVPDGTWFVALAPIEEADQVAVAVAQALELREIASEPLIDRLIAFLAPRRALLVIDNCEHLHDATAALIAQLIAACPNLRIVATSRMALRVPGEQTWRVGPLELPTYGDATDVTRLGSIPSMQLFVSRAESAVAQFRLTEHNAAAVVDICVRLAGIPLAIELAAAWTRVLTVQQIAEHLQDALAAQPAGRRNAISRQQTVRAALDWSYRLLGTEEQRLFARLAVFRDGCDLEIVEAVCAGNGLPLAATLGLLTHLVDQSLVQVEDGGRVARYRLLEPVRVFAEEQLNRSGDAESVAARHATTFHDLAMRGANELIGPDQVAWLDRFSSEHENLRTAMRWLVRQDDISDAVEMAVALAPFWSARGHMSEGRRWFDSLLARPGADPIPQPLRAVALLRSGELAIWQLDTDIAATMLEASIALAREAGDTGVDSEALSWLGSTRRRNGDAVGATEALGQALEIARRIDDRRRTATALIQLGMSAAYDGDLDASREFLDESLRLYRLLGDLRSIAIACTILGEVYRRRGDNIRATLLLREGLAGHRAVGDHSFLIVGLWQIATLIADEQPEIAARLLGAIQTLHNALGATQELRSGLNTVETMIARQPGSEALVTVRELLSEATLTQAIIDGRSMSTAQTTAMALAAVDTLSGRSDRILNS